MPKKSSFYTEATVRKTTQQIEVIDDNEEVKKGLDGMLVLNGKRILVCKGYDAMAAVFQTYLFLSNQFDEGPIFKMSKKARGLVWVDKKWGGWAKVPGIELIDYLSAHFIPCQLLTTAANGQTLMLLNSIPIQFAGVLLQTRFSGMFGDLFDWAD